MDTPSGDRRKLSPAGKAHGEPGARRRARRVRRAGRGNPPGVISAGRPGLTLTKQRYRDEHHLARYDEDTIERLNLAA